MLDNKFLGLPLVLWLVIVGTALLVDIPMVLLNTTTQKELVTLRNGNIATQIEVRRLEAAPTASPSALPTPTDVITTPIRRSSTLLPVKPSVTSQVK